MFDTNLSTVKEPFPISWPVHEHRSSCNAHVPANPISAQSSIVAPVKLSMAKAEERENTTWSPGIKTSWAKQPGVKSEESKAVNLPPGRPTAVSRLTPTGANIAPVSGRSKAGSGAQVFEPQSTPYSSSSASARPPMPPPGPKNQGSDIYFTSGQVSLQPPQGKNITLSGTPLQDVNAENTTKELFAPTAKVAYEISVPVSIMNALAAARTGNLIPDGAVVMQNMDSTICQTENVALMTGYLLAESADSISSIGNGLKCHFRYKQNWNRDLILWVEPFSLGDAVAFSGGHLFLKGWVQRNLSFGVVKPSFCK